MAKVDMWTHRGIPGFAMRFSKLTENDLEDYRMNNLNIWRYEHQLWRFSTKDEIMGLIRDVYDHWVDLSGEGKNLILLHEVGGYHEIRARVDMVLRQLVDAHEIFVGYDKKTQLPVVDSGDSLRAALILEAVDDLANHTSFSKCAHCEGWFPQRRKDAQFCSGRCQIAYWRDRKKEPK